ncbi:tetratricopeptide repeat protein [Bacteroides caecigallinarum]|uniref:tetratricopeptide repeat protein n=1 Tax=Bacteroides caecigallinarum TaxID=1411144 RepID=UPI001F2AEA32|nr:tetratricopeptide repeat protein [Bacteroides caecigallinarum]MCF2551257.1 tetratricopeptide repeat protein [Bacteroides caecigallinarum]
MKKIFILIIISLCTFSKSYSQAYNEVVERAMKYALSDSLVQAEQLFREALKMDPNNARNALLFSNLGTVLKRMGRTDEAIEAYTMALNITPYSTAMLLNRGTLYLDKGLDSKAYVDFCNVIDLIPENIEARLYRAYIYMQRREYKEARIDYNVIVGKEPSHKAARIGLAMLDQREGNLTAARDKLNLLIGEFTDDASLLLMRANLDLERGYPEAAVIDLEEALRLNPKDAETTVQLGDVYLSLKDKNKALKAYEKAISLGIPRSALINQMKKCK